MISSLHVIWNVHHNIRFSLHDYHSQTYLMLTLLSQYLFEQLNEFIVLVKLFFNFVYFFPLLASAEGL